VAIAFTTLGNTEFHRRVTFAGRTSRPGKRRLQDLLSFTFYAGYGSIVLFSLDDLVSHPSALLEATGQRHRRPRTFCAAALVGLHRAQRLTSHACQSLTPRQRKTAATTASSPTTGSR
jgi:hypothetical protein